MFEPLKFDCIISCLQSYKFVPRPWLNVCLTSLIECWLNGTLNCDDDKPEIIGLELKTSERCMQNTAKAPENVLFLAGLMI